MALWIHGELIGFLDVYVPNHAIAQVGFWTQIMDVLHDLDHWFVEGNFNMLEDPMDRIWATM